MSPARPRIGLTTYYKEAAWGVWRREAAIVPSSYVEAVVRAGGTPLLLPPMGSDVSIVHDLDGLVMIGGSDLDPATYAAPAHPASAPEPYRDEYEFALVRAALEGDLPTLAICRGIQVLNVALGGTLHQHVPEVIGHSRYQPTPGVFGDVTVSTEPGSLINSIVGPTFTSPCYHHQSIDVVAQGLVVTAASDDSVIQAVETTSAGWALGVQFHPEENADDDRLFAALITAAQQPVRAH